MHVAFSLKTGRLTITLFEVILVHPVLINPEERFKLATATLHYTSPVYPVRLLCLAVTVLDCDGEGAMSTMLTGLKCIHDNMWQPGSSVLQQNVSPLVTLSLKLYCAVVRVMDCDGEGAMSTIVTGLEWIYDNMVQPAVGHFKHVCHFC